MSRLLVSLSLFHKERPQATPTMSSALQKHPYTHAWCHLIQLRPESSSVKVPFGTAMFWADQDIRDPSEFIHACKNQDLLANHGSSKQAFRGLSINLGSFDAGIEISGDMTATYIAALEIKCFNKLAMLNVYTITCTCRTLTLIYGAVSVLLSDFTLNAWNCAQNELLIELEYAGIFTRITFSAAFEIRSCHQWETNAI